MRGPASGLRFEHLGGSPPRVVVYGVTAAQLLEHAAEAVFGMNLDLTRIAPTYSRPIVSPGDTLPELLVNWLDELRFIGQRDAIAWSWFVVDRLEEGGTQGSAAGLPMSEVEMPAEVVVGIRLVSEGVVEVPEGLWVELELTLGSPLRAVP